MGVLVVPSFLLYATGGFAYGGARSDTTIVQSIDDPPLSTLMTSGSFSKTRVGYAVGAGGEWMLSSNWSAKPEYLTNRQSPAVNTSVSGAPHSPFKCDPNRENRLTSTDWPMPRRAGVVHVCIQIEINCLVD
jgi:opacity protein-like surface antigen